MNWSDTEPPRVAVVGAGAIGLLFAARFGKARTNGAVTIVTRRDTVRAALESSGICITPPSATRFAVPPERIEVVKPSASLRFHDLVVVACRSEESGYALDTAGAVVAEDGVVVVVQNGLRAWELARAGGRPCLCGATYEIAHRVSLNELEWTRVAYIEVAAPGASERSESDVRRVVRAFESAALRIRVGTSEADVLWRKLVLTLPNWVAAAVGAPLHAIVESPRALRLLDELVLEIAPIAAADGVDLDYERAAADFRSLRGSGSVGSAFAALTRSDDLEVVDICRSVIERGRRLGLSTQWTEALLRLAQVQQDVFPRRDAGW